MFRLFKKYNLFIVLALVLLVTISCHKGDEPIPLSSSSYTNSVDNNGSSLKTGDPKETDSGTIIGGDDNEDDDDGDNTIGGSPGDGGSANGNGG